MPENVILFTRMPSSPRIGSKGIMMKIALIDYVEVWNDVTIFIWSRKLSFYIVRARQVKNEEALAVGDKLLGFKGAW